MSKVKFQDLGVSKVDLKYSCSVCVYTDVSSIHEVVFEEAILEEIASLLGIIQYSLKIFDVSIILEGKENKYDRISIGFEDIISYIECDECDSTCEAEDLEHDCSNLNAHVYEIGEKAFYVNGLSMKNEGLIEFVVEETKRDLFADYLRRKFNISQK